jgi:di/tricarboxylate transporter
MQGSSSALAEFGARYGCVPLAQRQLKLDRPERALTAAVVLLGAIALTVTGLASPATAFAAGVLLYLILGIVSPREVYQSVDWPVVVLLGALIPVAGAMATTGAADLIASVLLDGLAQGRPVLALILMLVLSMTLSDFMNNAATAAVMCPIAIGTADRLSASADPFLMAVAVGASCAFLTPIGHQNNTLILGPGGFRFGDYWRLGLPLELIVVAVAIPAILWAWPLAG